MPLPEVPQRVSCDSDAKRPISRLLHELHRVLRPNGHCRECILVQDRRVEVISSYYFVLIIMYIYMIICGISLYTVVYEPREIIKREGDRLRDSSWHLNKQRRH